MPTFSPFVVQWLAQSMPSVNICHNGMSEEALKKLYLDIPSSRLILADGNDTLL